MNKNKIFVAGMILLFTQLIPVRSQNSQYPAYDSLRVIEKVYLHLDRESYYPGDDIWFKAYLIDATDRWLTDNSMNLHVELISPDLKIIDSRIIRLDNGLGNGDFHLSEKIQSGRYSIRAYTNYMRNFGDQLFFNKDIMIINSSDALNAFTDSTSNNRNKPEISFFPEGGSLVDNVTSKVAFKAVDGHGYSQTVNGEIYSSEGEMVAEFKSSHKGMGSFSLTPVQGLKYFAIIQTHNGDSLKYELPKSFSTGIVLAVSENRKNELAISLRTNSQTLPFVLDHDLSIVVSARNILLKTYSFRMKSLNSFLNLSTDDIPDGIVMLTLSGADNIPLCERLVYIQNNEEVRVKVETNKSEYNKRDSVSLKISLMSNSNTSQDAYLSLSATDSIFTDNSSRFPSNISSWFLLESDVRGPVEEPSYYFDPSNPERLIDLDLLLLTQGWRDFVWKYKTVIYPPENGFTISGRVRKKLANVSVKNSMVNIAIFKTGKPLISVVPVDSSGRFCLKGEDFTGSAKLIASVTGEKNDLKGWLLLDSVKYSPAIVKTGISQRTSVGNSDQNINDDQTLTENQITNKSLHTYIQYVEIKNSIKKKYKLSDTIAVGEVNIIAVRQDKPESARAQSRRYLRGTPDVELVITPDLQFYNNAYYLIKNKFLAPVKGVRLGHRLEHPLYMIDGNTASESDVEALPISWVERIDVVNDEISNQAIKTPMEVGEIRVDGKTVRVFGYSDGAISIILKKDKDIVNNLVYHSVNVKFSGFNEPRIFYSPKHHTTLESDYKPDIRTTLIWEPNIKLENNKEVLLNYYNSDNPSKVKVIVEGITTGGIPVTGITEYEVK
jgi:hypothetical protein